MTGRRMGTFARTVGGAGAIPGRRTSAGRNTGTPAAGRAGTWIGRRYRIEGLTREMGSKARGEARDKARVEARDGARDEARGLADIVRFLGLVRGFRLAIIQLGPILSASDQLRHFQHEHVEEDKGDDSRRLTLGNDVARTRRDVVGDEVSAVKNLFRERSVVLFVETAKVRFCIPTQGQQNHRKRCDHGRKRPRDAEPIHVALFIQRRKRKDAG